MIHTSLASSNNISECAAPANLSEYLVEQSAIKVVTINVYGSAHSNLYQKGQRYYTYYIIRVQSYFIPIFIIFFKESTNIHMKEY